MSKRCLLPAQNFEGGIAGNVEAYGEGATEFHKADRVAAFHEMFIPHDAFAEYSIAWAHQVELAMVRNPSDPTKAALVATIHLEHQKQETNAVKGAQNHNGQSTRDASSKWGVPRSTLQSRLKGTQPRAAAFSELQRLSISQEAKLASWVQIQADLGLTPTHQQIREFAQRILNAIGDTQPLGKR
ncbi:putative transposase [Colletotrichum incanum]|uniref:Putative transposase n=1 Tax=Colletotrichum incanum TaxID=1573173 RepID=A0A167BQ93_COLIC|nr:putative transposase [Colletotrichum incanum]